MSTRYTLDEHTEASASALAAREAVVDLYFTWLGMTCPWLLAHVKVLAHLAPEDVVTLARQWEIDFTQAVIFGTENQPDNLANEPS